MARLFPKDDSDFEVTISTHTIVRVIVLFALTYIFFISVKHSLHTLTLIGVAVFLSLALNAPVHWLAGKIPGKKRGSRSLATAISVIFIVLLLTGFLMAIVPPLVRQTTSFAQNVPQLISDTKNGTGPIGHFVATYHLQSHVQDLSNQLSNRLGNISSSALGTLSRISRSVFSVLTVIVLTVMMLIEGPKWRKVFWKMIATKRKTHVMALTHEMNKVIQGYVNGQVLLAAIAAVILLPMLFIMNVSYPIALMVIVFICGLIPLVGHTIGAIIVTTIALFTSATSAVVILGYYILYQQIENYAVQPRIQANSTNMSPLLVFLSVIIGINFGGLLGGLVAIPVAGCLRILALDYLEHRDILTEKVVEKLETPN
jgi:predicted PurR-regulated permease PerM